MGKAATKSEMIGRKIGALEVIADTGKRDNRRNILWLCRCECGKEKEYSTAVLNFQKVRSCGCQVGERTKKRISKNGDNVYKYYEGTSITRIESIINGATQKNSKTGVTGVSMVNRKGKIVYEAYIKIKRKLFHLGRYEKIEDAIRVRKEAEKSLFVTMIDDYSTKA